MQFRAVTHLNRRIIAANRASSPFRPGSMVNLMESFEDRRREVRQAQKGLHFALLYSSSLTGFNQFVFPFWVGVTAM